MTHFQSDTPRSVAAAPAVPETAATTLSDAIPRVFPMLLLLQKTMQRGSELCYADLAVTQRPLRVAKLRSKRYLMTTSHSFRIKTSKLTKCLLCHSATSGRHSGILADQKTDG